MNFPEIKLVLAKDRLLVPMVLLHIVEIGLFAIVPGPLLFRRDERVDGQDKIGGVDDDHEDGETIRGLGLVAEPAERRCPGDRTRFGEIPW